MNDRIRVSELLFEYDERLGDKDEPVVLTLTEKRGFIPQEERFNKRLATLDTSNYKVVRRFDIAYNQNLLWAGAIAQNKDWDMGIVSPAYPTFRVREGFDLRYVDWLLAGDPIRLHYDAISFGAVPRRRRTKISDFLALEIPKPPPLTEQKRIAGILDAADALRAKRRAVLDKLDALLQSTFLDLFGDPVTNPMGWRVVPLESLIDAKRPITYGILKPGPDIENGIPYVRFVDIKDSQVLTEQLRRTTEEIAHQNKRSQIRHGDLLMSIRGLVGRMAITPRDAEGANITQDTARLALTDANATYVMQCIATPGMQQYMGQRTKGIAIRGINLSDVKKLPIPTPPYELQQHFAEVVRSIEHQNTRMRSHLAELDALFASLQSRAFNGGL